MNILIALFMWMVVIELPCIAHAFKDCKEEYAVTAVNAKIILVITIAYTGMIIGRLIGSWLK